MRNIQIKKLKEQIDIDYTSKHMSCNVRALTFVQGESTIFFIPSLQISGYGSNEDEAREMVEIVVADYFENLMKLSLNDVKTEFESLGFRKTAPDFTRFERVTEDIQVVIREHEIHDCQNVKETMFEIGD